MDEEDRFKSYTPFDTPLLTFVRDHAALVIPIIGALIFVWRCIIVSEGDPYVAYILVTQTSVGDAVRALFFVALPVLLFLLSYAASLTVATRIRRGRWRNRRTLGEAIASVALLLALWSYIDVFYGYSPSVIGPMIFLPIVAYIFVGRVWDRELKAWRRRERRRRRHSPGDFFSDFERKPWGWRSYLMMSVVTVSIAVFLGSLFLQGLILEYAFSKDLFWLPHERLDFKHEPPFTGYVLKVSEDYLVILNDNPRVIVQRDKELLEDRDFCYGKDHKARASNVKSDAPECP
jgi:hypothetical protein